MNLYRISILTKKETLRFLKVYHQTIFAPIVNALLLLAVFSLSIGEYIKISPEVTFIHFMSSGLIIMVSMQNAFANSSSSLVMGKVLGYIIDYLIPPFSPIDIIIAFTIGAVARAILIAIIMLFIIWALVDISIYNISYIFFHIIAASIFLAFLGILCGILSNSFDQMTAVTSYFITPLTFLSGTFYSTKNLPEILENISHFNPFFYMIDGFRYGITGYHDGNLQIGIIFIIIVNIILFFTIYSMLKTGYKIKS